MISVYKLKPKFQQLLEPVLMQLRKLGVSPNALTIAAFVLSIIIGILFLIYESHPAVLLFCASGLLIRMALNALDGMMAKRFSMQSKLGEVLNELSDVLSDLVIYLPLVIIPSVSPYVVVSFVILAMLNEFSGVLAKAVSGTRRYDGPMGKSDRSLLIGLFYIGLFIWGNLAEYTNWILGFGCLLLVYSTLIRIVRGLR